MAFTFRSALGIVACAGLTHSIQAQAYRVTVVSDAEIGPGRVLAITDAGDAVVRVGNSLAIWQESPGFGRVAGLTIVGEIDPGAVNRVSRHIDAEARFYGSLKGLASAWSQDTGHADLDTRHDIGSWIDDASWPAFLVGGEQGLRDGITPVLWSDGVRIELPLPPGVRSATATGVNDGGEIVGVAAASTDAALRSPAVAASFDRDTTAIAWLGSGPIGLNEHVVGSDLTIVRADDVNNRGQIAATAVDAAGLFYAVILEPAGADMNGDGAVSPADLNAWIAFAAANDNRGDLTDDGSVDSADFAAVVERISTRFDFATPAISDEARAIELSHALNTNGVYDAIDADAEPGGFVPGNSAWQNWLDCGPACWNEYHSQFNPNCYGCDGDDPDNPDAPDGAPGWPGSGPGNPYAPNGGPGGDGDDGDPAGDGGDGGNGEPGVDPEDPGGEGGPGGDGGDNTDDGNGGKGGDGGSGGNGGTGNPGTGDGGNGGAGADGGKGGSGGPNGGNGGKGGDGGNGGSGGADTGGNGGAGSEGGQGGDGGDSPSGDGGEGGEGGDGGNGGAGSAGGSGAPGGDGGDGGDSNGSGSGGAGGDGGPGGTGGNGTGGRDGAGGSDGSDGSDGSP